MIYVYIIISSLFLIIISYKRIRTKEPYIVLKLIILYLISAVAIFINDIIPIPIGFALAWIITRKSSLNKRAKSSSCLFGLINTSICVILHRISLL